MVKFAQHIEWAPPNHPHSANNNGNSNVKKLHKTLGELFNLQSNPMVSNPNPTDATIHGATTKRNASRENKKGDLVYSKSGPLFSNPPYQHYVLNRNTWSSAQVRHHGLSEEEKEMEFMCYCCDDLTASAPQSGEMGHITRKKSVGFEQNIVKNPSRKSKEFGHFLKSPSRKSGELGKNANKNASWKSSDSEQNARSPSKSFSAGFWHGGRDSKDSATKSRGLGHVASESERNNHDEKKTKKKWPNIEGLIMRKKDQKKGGHFHSMFGKGMFALHRNASRKIDDNGEEDEDEDEEDEDEDGDEDEDDDGDYDDDGDGDGDGDGHSDGHQNKMGNPRKKESKKAMVSVEIPEKMLGLAWIGSTPLLLPAGVHEFGPEGFVLQEVVSENTSFVKHGNLHRVRIRDGHLGVAWVDGAAFLLEPGVSVHTCAGPASSSHHHHHKFSYITTDDTMLSEKEFVLGPFRVVNVDDTEVGIKFCNRLPQILYSGRHCLSISRLEVFAGFESLLKRQSNVCGVSAMSKDDRKVTVDVSLEWQIGPDDAAAARVANVTDVDAGISEKVRRAFSLVMWEVNADDIRPNDDTLVMTRLSGDVRRELMDLFEEGWTITLWELQVKRLTISSEES